ncbi:MAG: 30S ribosomal protein S8 [Parcubacteria group bacterium]
MTDPIADMLTRIRNAQMAKRKEVLMPYSKIKFAIARILEKEKFVAKAEELSTESGIKELSIKLKYENGKPAISRIARVSKLGCRVYAGKEKLPRVLNNFGIAVVSTSRGVMTNKEARKLGVGGEVLCEIY